MRKLAISVATIGFFVLAFVGWFSGVPAFVCGLRALAGAAALYVLINLAGSAVIRIIVDAAIKARQRDPNTGDERT